MKALLSGLLLIFSTLTMAQYPKNQIDKSSAFSQGEYMKFKFKYGFVSAGYGELRVFDRAVDNQFHFEAKGWSASFFDPFFKVRDYYDSYVDKTTMKPKRFTRDIEEGNFKKKQQVDFIDSKAYSNEDTISMPDNTQDLISFFYHLRNQPLDTLDFKSTIDLPIYLDDEVFYTQFTYEHDEYLGSIIGRKKCMVFSVRVMSGRVFSDSEPVKVWVSKDEQKIPMKLKADLAVGSVKMVLDKYTKGG
ncbi:MAG: DUF3108 domain-containing protein [Flavobacteriales bacterium]